MTRRPVLRRHSYAAALTCAAVVALAGCGQATEAPEATAPEARAADTSTSSSDLPQPQWPSLGCESRSVVSVDYGRVPRGFESPEEAVEHSAAAGLPDGRLTMAPYPGKGPAQVWVVDPATGEIQAQVSVFRGPGGWFVDGVMTCS